MREQLRVGIEYLHDATTLLRRVRAAHPTAGLYEAADLQFWWRIPRSTDNVGQLFWFDDLGRPEGAVIATDWGDVATDWSDGIALAPITLPGATPDRVTEVIERGLAHAAESGFGVVEIEVDRADDVTRQALAGHGFSVKGDGVVEAWLAADDRPEVGPLHDGYRSCTRLDTMPRPHHMVHRSGPEVETRLGQTSLYRPDLDLVILDGEGGEAAYGLFWFDPETATGLVEPMRTADDHQRRGLARHLLTTGIALLAEAGAERIKICFEPDNAASSGLYLDVGFEPVRQTVLLSGQPSAPAS
ncbi:MAG: GNAT family N-acetyltransferase [Acidimicrobiales bacterium]